MNIKDQGRRNKVPSLSAGQIIKRLEEKRKRRKGRRNG
jgi:hypothetical protein